MGESFLRKIVRIYYDECIVILYKVSENIGKGAARIASLTLK